jgi:hypothetical protein
VPSLRHSVTLVTNPISKILIITSAISTLRRGHRGGLSSSQAICLAAHAIFSRRLSIGVHGTPPNQLTSRQGCLPARAMS